MPAFDAKQTQCVAGTAPSADVALALGSNANVPLRKNTKKLKTWHERTEGKKTKRFQEIVKKKKNPHKLKYLN